MIRTLARRCGWLSVLLVAAAGCGRDGLVSVQGTVKLNGQLLANATVQFIAPDRSGKDAMGSTDATGVFHLSARPGRYKVVVQPPAAADGGARAATQEEAQRPGRAKPRRPSTIPPRWSQSDQTTLVQD